MGVALRKIVLSVDGVQISIDYDAPILCVGYHGPEVSKGFRWTDGDAPLPAALLQAFTGAVGVQLHIGCTARYPLQQISIARAAWIPWTMPRVVILYQTLDTDVRHVSGGAVMKGS